MYHGIVPKVIDDIAILHDRNGVMRLISIGGKIVNEAERGGCIDIDNITIEGAVVYDNHGVAHDAWDIKDKKDVIIITFIYKDGVYTEFER